MSDVIERIKRKIIETSAELVEATVTDTIIPLDEALAVIDEESAKEPQDDVPVQCIDGSCPMALAEEYAECGMDVVHSCDECQYKPAKEPQVRQWIPCSERLPDEAFPCLVTVIDTNPMTMEDFNNILPYFVGYDGETWNDEDGEVIPFEVIAWQHLPSVWKGENNAEK